MQGPSGATARSSLDAEEVVPVEVDSSGRAKHTWFPTGPREPFVIVIEDPLIEGDACPSHLPRNRASTRTGHGSGLKQRLCRDLSLPLTPVRNARGLPGSALKAAQRHAVLDKSRWRHGTRRSSSHALKATRRALMPREGQPRVAQRFPAGKPGAGVVSLPFFTSAEERGALLRPCGPEDRDPESGVSQLWRTGLVSDAPSTAETPGGFSGATTREGFSWAGTSG